MEIYKSGKKIPQWEHNLTEKQRFHCRMANKLRDCIQNEIHALLLTKPLFRLDFMALTQN